MVELSHWSTPYINFLYSCPIQLKLLQELTSWSAPVGSHTRHATQRFVQKNTVSRGPWFSAMTCGISVLVEAELVLSIVTC